VTTAEHCSCLCFEPVHHQAGNETIAAINEPALAEAASCLGEGKAASVGGLLALMISASASARVRAPCGRRRRSSPSGKGTRPHPRTAFDRGLEVFDVHLGPVRAVVDVHHTSRFNLQRPQCGSLRSGLNSRTMFRFKARITPILANMVGPPTVATRINASIAVCHSGAVCSAFDSLVMHLPASCSVTSWRPPGSGIGSSNGRFQPLGALREEISALLRERQVGAGRMHRDPAARDSGFRVCRSTGNESHLLSLMSTPRVNSGTAKPPEGALIDPAPGCAVRGERRQFRQISSRRFDCR
jgi:hypothetical protein